MKKEIEEKAKEYANEQWSPDSGNDFSIDKTTLRKYAIEDFIEGADYIQHLNRWRKVEEELPEVKDKTYQILLRVISEPVSTSVWNVRNEHDSNLISMLKGCEWKPIN